MAKRKNIVGAVSMLLVLFAIGFVAVNIAGYYGYAIRKSTLKSGLVRFPSYVDSLSQQASILVKNGFIKDSAEYVLFGKKNGFDKKIYAGQFKIDSAVSYKRLLNTIGNNKQTPVRVTFNNIRSFEKLAGVTSKYIETDSVSMLKAFKSDETAKKYGFDNANFLGMFIPNTYEFYWNTSADEFIDRMNKEYKRFWNDDRISKLKNTNLSQQEVSILASIVIEESKVASEMPCIAGVYLNRIRKGMPLQADPTVKFAVGDPTIKRVLLKHLDTDSPYNTYKYQGLPPGVICMPPIVAIDAVLNHEKHEYLYFCADADLSGKHVFAKNLAAHNINAKKYHAAINKLKIR